MRLKTVLGDVEKPVSFQFPRFRDVLRTEIALKRIYRLKSDSLRLLS